MARAIAPGARTNPAASDESPLTCEIKSGIETKHETLVSMVKNPISTAATNAVFLKSSGDTNGWAALVIRHANRTAARADPIKLPQDVAEVNPATWPWVIPNKKSPAANPNRIPPGKSNQCSPVGVVCGSTNQAPRIKKSVRESVP